MISRPSKKIDKLSENLVKKAKNEIIQYRKGEIQAMRLKYVLFYFFYVIITAFCFYYVMVFCAIYQGSSLNWLSDGFLAIFLVYVSKIFIISFIMFMRVLMRKYPNKFIRVVHWVINKAA